jgi:hypothetical protein
VLCPLQMTGIVQRDKAVIFPAAFENVDGIRNLAQPLKAVVPQAEYSGQDSAVDHTFPIQFRIDAGK